MTNHQLNEPAFPIRGGLHEHQFVGASLRDYFAAKAMQGFVSSYPNGNVNCDFEYLADDAYDMADAMLKARAKGGADRAMRAAQAAPASQDAATGLKDGDIAALVNRLRDIAIEYTNPHKKD